MNQPSPAAAGDKSAAANTAGINRYIRGGKMPADGAANSGNAGNSAGGNIGKNNADLGDLAAVVTKGRYTLQAAQTANDEQAVQQAQNALSNLEQHVAVELGGQAGDADSAHVAVTKWLTDIIGE